MDRIFITDLVAQGIIGVYPWEREQKQEIVISAVLFTELRAAGEGDDLSLSVDYAEMAGRLREHAETASRLTLEALAKDLADICLSDDLVKKVQVRVEKPGAVRFARSVGVEIERTKAT